MDPTLGVERRNEVQAAVVDRVTLRDLPWRATRDPWAILVAEVMLQQTQVPRVIPRYGEFLARFPDVAACARARRGEVVAAWAGLGYNRRAVNLHACAQLVTERHGGALPVDFAALRALPGIGEYTARAVLAFAHERDVAVVDTNVARVLARVMGEPLTRRGVQTLADSLVPPAQGWRWNQAMLDLGALVCTARSPRCGECPLVSTCAWRGGDRDPALQSAGLSGRQSRFHGSDRQGRGRLVDALRRGPVALCDLPETMGWPGDAPRAERVAMTLIADGLAVRLADCLALP